MNRSQSFAGGMLVLVGTLFLLDALDVLSAGAVVGDWWPTVIILLGASRFLGRPPDVLGGAITAAIGLALLGVTLDVLEASVVAVVWPLALIGLGTYLVLARRRPEGQLIDDDTVSAVVLFSVRELAPTSRAFAGGSLTAVFGGFEVDLRGCRLAEGAHLEVTAVFGGCEIRVPTGWRVRITGPTILGGIEDGTQGQQLPPDAPVLELELLTVFGGVEVKAVPLPVASTP